MISRWRAGAALAAISMLISGACSTTQHRQTAKAGSNTGAVSGVTPGGGDQVPSTAAPGTGGAQAARASRGPSTGGAGAAPSPAGTKGAAGSASGSVDTRAMGHGITATKIQLGMSWIDINAFLAAVSAAYGTPGPQQSQPTTRDWAQLAVNYQNARGGIAGRQIDPVYYQYPVNDLFTPQGRAQAEQEMCASFTQDHKVFAMIPLVSNEGVLTQCAKNADTPAIMVAMPPPSQRVKPRTCTNNQNPRITGSRFRMNRNYTTRRTDARKTRRTDA